MKRGFRIRGVLFDFDGTLTCPGALDFAEIREAIGCPPGKSILDFIDSLKNTDEKNRVTEILNGFEMEGAEKSVPNPDVEMVFQFLRSNNLYIGMITRNGLQPVTKALENFTNIRIDDFQVVITRDDDLQPKPSGAGVRFAAERFAVPPEEILVVGDYIYDMEAGNRAGALTALLHHPGINLSFQVESDFIISQLGDITKIIRLGLPLPPGKLPSDLLADFLEGLALEDPSVLVPPGIGEDTAVVAMENEAVLVMKSDPITFVTSEIGYYTVLVNANDIATSGAKPRWLLSTLLFPVGTTPSSAICVMNELKTTCRKWAISLCGGHTEVTSAVNRPVVVGMLSGTVAKDKLIDKRHMRAGDLLLITKKVAVEGTAILAGELGGKLQQLGIPVEQIESAKRLKADIGVLQEAAIAADHDGVSAMHDVTEGGLAAAVTELAIAGNHTIRIHLEKIRFYPETTAICEKMNLDPLGLIGSGTLLICCRRESAQELMEKIKYSGVDIACIGEVGSAGTGVEAFREGQKTVWPCFQADEITRVL